MSDVRNSINKSVIKYETYINLYKLCKFKREYNFKYDVLNLTSVNASVF